MEEFNATKGSYYIIIIVIIIMTVKNIIREKRKSIL